MSVQAMDTVWRADLRPTTLKLTALALADWCDPDGSRLFPSMQAVGEKVGVSRSQAQRLMRELIEAGLLQVEANANGGRPGTTPHYRLRLDRIANLPQTGSADAIPTGSANATGSTGATGRMDAQTGSTGAMGGVAPMRQTGSTGATLTVSEPPVNRQGTTRERRVRAARSCPDAFQVTPNLTAWAAEKFPAVDIAAETDKFRDHTFKAPVSEWPKAWRNWIRRAHEFGHVAQQAPAGKQGAPGRQTGDQLRAASLAKAQRIQQMGGFDKGARDAEAHRLLGFAPVSPAAPTMTEVTNEQF